MRIIAGEFRGRKLLPPQGDTTRPITDRVKQSLFDILTTWWGGHSCPPSFRVYDLFAGTGSMGLECLSRGAAHATFFESDRSALVHLKKNIAALQVEDRAQIIPGDLFKYFASNTPNEKANLIFLDPPYRFLREQAEKLCDLANSLATHHLAPDGLLVFRHDIEDALQLPSLKTTDRREYGGMTLEFLQCNGSSTER